MWWFQFVGTYDKLVVLITFLTLISVAISVRKAIPSNTSDFAKTYYQFNWKNREEAFSKLSETTVSFLATLTPSDEMRVRRGLGLMVSTTTPAATIDLAFSSKVSTSQSIIPFPMNGPWMGDGQYSTHQEMEFLIDKGLIRQVPWPQTIQAGQVQDFFSGDHIVRIQPTAAITYQAYFATTLARELILAGNDQEYWYQTMLWRLKTRVLQNVNVWHGSYQIKEDIGRRWVEPTQLTEFVLTSP